MRLAAQGFGFAMMLMPLTACFGADECDPYAARCEGNAILSCVRPCREPGCGTTWHVEPCDSDQVCVEEEGAPEPFCALSASADPRCETSRFYCDGDYRVHCEGNHAIWKEDCAQTQGTCAELPESTIHCALSNEPDPRCEGLPPIGEVCDGSILLRCQQGFALEAEACPSACASAEGGEAFCAISDEPAARCDEDAPIDPRGFHCVGNTVARCDHGYERVIASCGDWSICDDSDDSDFYSACVPR